MQSLSIQIRGMSCGHCVGAVRGALEGLPGVQVQEVRVGSAAVTYDPAGVSAEQISEAIRAEGYEPLDPAR